MKCLNCKKDNLYCHGTIAYSLPLSKKGGTIKLKGFSVTHEDLKASWDKTPLGDKKVIRGPIECLDCGTEHTYISGLQPSLWKVPYAEAVEKGFDHFAKQATRVSEEDSAEE